MATPFSGKKGIIIPAALALIAVLLSIQYINQREKELGLLAEPKPVLFATKDIPRMTKLDENLLEVRQVPAKFVQPGALTDVQQGVNQVTTAPILQGEQVLDTKLVSYGVETGLAIKVPTSFRAVTIAVTDVSGVAGLIKPGNYVDVLGTFDFGDKMKSDQKTFTLMANVLVLAVEQNLGPESDLAKARAMKGKDSGLVDLGPGRFKKEKEFPTNVTLALAPKGAQEIVLAQEAGKITLVLRSMFEGHQSPRVPATSLSDLLGVQERVVYRPQPSWREIRGTSSGAGY